VPADAYMLRLTATTADGARTADEVGVVIERLPVSIAERALAEQYLGSDDTRYVSDCRRMGALRVDCSVPDADVGCDDRSTYNAAIRVDRAGQLIARNYPCGRYLRRPRSRSRSYRLPQLWPISSVLGTTSSDTGGERCS
jgi:hypothetical protein